MKYADGGAFRRALEDRLNSQARTLGLPLVRLRKMVAFERFVARLAADQPRCWLLKGGLALQWRLGNVARTTKDLDVLLAAPAGDIHQALVRAALLDLADWFRFLVLKPNRMPPQQAGGGERFSVQSLLGGRPFEEFHVDVGWGDPVVEPPEALVAPSLLEFASIEPVTALCYPLTQHIAEKVHAYTRPHPSGDSSRVKDLLDILLIARAGTLSGASLRRALQATFAARQTHPLPARLPDPPSSWGLPFRRMAKGLSFPYDSLDVATDMARRFLDPIFGNQVVGEWIPTAWHWREET